MNINFCKIVIVSDVNNVRNFNYIIPPYYGGPFQLYEEYLKW